MFSLKKWCSNNEFIEKINEVITDEQTSFYNVTDFYTPEEYKKMAVNRPLKTNESALIQPFLDNNISQDEKNIKIKRNGTSGGEYPLGTNSVSQDNVSQESKNVKLSKEGVNNTSFN